MINPFFEEIDPPERIHDLPTGNNNWIRNGQTVEEYLNVANWICPKCKLTNFGHNKTCADWRCKTPRVETSL